MTKGEETRSAIVRKAAPLFNQKGFEGTSLSDLMRATRLEKGGIYRHFSSKEELAGEAFDYAWGRAFDGRLDGVEEVLDSVDRLKKMISNFVELRAGLVPGGCPLLNAAIEADDGNAMLRGRARSALQSWTNRLSKIVAEGIRKREIAPRTDPDTLASLIIGSLEGALMISRLQHSDEALRAAREHLEEHLESRVRALAGPRKAEFSRASANKRSSDKKGKTS
jgi:TetR/AcrR family transcriptional regulator, transcriptional repressor for nem operon